MPAVMRRFSLLLLTSALASCAWFGDDDGLQPAELVEFEPTVELERVWSTSVGAGQDRRYTRFVPALSEDRIFVADHEGRVFALNRATGEKLWERDTNLPISGAVGAGDGMVLVGTYDAEVVALSQEDGEELWRSRASSEILAPPQTNGSVVAVQTVDGRVFTYDAETGERRWSYDHPLPNLTLRTTARPLLTENQLFIGFDNGQLVCFNPGDGVIQWTLRVGRPQGQSDLDRVVDVETSPMLVESMVYTAAYQGAVMAASRGTGRMIWRQDASTYLDLAAGNEQVYAVLEDSTLVAYGAASGSVAWQNEQMLRRGLSAPATLGNYVAAVDDEGYMHVLSQEDGSFVERLEPPGDGFRSPLISVDEVLYVFSDDGRLTAYRVAEQD